MPADRIDCPRRTLHLPAVGKFVHAVPAIAFVVYLHAVGGVLLWLWQDGTHRMHRLSNARELAPAGHQGVDVLPQLIRLAARVPVLVVRLLPARLRSALRTCT